MGLSKFNKPEIIEEIIKLYKEHKNISKLSKITDLSYNTIRKILRTNGIIDKDQFKPDLKVYMLDKINGNSIKEFDKISDAVKYIKENTSFKGSESTIRKNIIMCSEGKRHTAYGYNWKIKRNKPTIQR